MSFLKAFITKEYFQKFFYFFSSLLALLIFLELSKPRIISAYLDINRVLLVWLASAIILLFWGGNKNRSNF